jgi:transcriptional regulator with XRE-family HTH domain
MIDIKEKYSHIDILSQYDMKMQLRYIKARINRIRLDKNLKQLEFADSIGLSQSGYSTLMGRDGTSQRLKTLALAIEAVYGFRHEWILTGEEPKQKGTQKHLEPVQRVQLDILNQDGIAPELKAESLKLMVLNLAHGVLLGMMMISLRHSRNIQNRGAPKKILDKYEQNRIKANELLNKFDIAFEEGCNKLDPQEQIVLVCEVYVELQQIKYNCLQSIGDDVSKSKVGGILNGLVEIIELIRELTKYDDKYDKLPKETLPKPDELKKVAKGKIKLIKIK